MRPPINKRTLSFNKKVSKRHSDTQKFVNYAIMAILQMLDNVPQRKAGDQSFEVSNIFWP